MNTPHPENRAARRTVSALVVLALLSGCLSEDESADDGSSASPAPGANNPPTISGNPPAAVTIGQAYSFTPRASDSDGDSLTFSIRNQPTWASFDSSTGRLFGTPSLGDIGMTASIEITVSDGQASASTGAFSIDVTQVATRSTTLSWTAPTLNEDGTTVTDLAGYRIYYGTSSGNYSSQIQIDNPSITTYVVENLSPGTYYFVATAFNTVGEESRNSGEAVRNLN